VIVNLRWLQGMSNPFLTGRWDCLFETIRRGILINFLHRPRKRDTAVHRGEDREVSSRSLSLFKPKKIWLAGKRKDTLI